MLILKTATGVRPAIFAIPGFEYSWLPSAATIENRKGRRPDAHLVFPPVSLKVGRMSLCISAQRDQSLASIGTTSP